MSIQSNETLALVLARLETLDRGLDSAKTDLKAKFESLERAVENLDHKLYGNGQPGVISDINDDILNLRDERVKDIGDLREERVAMERRMLRIGIIGTAVVVVCVLLVGKPQSISGILKMIGLL